MVSQFKRKFLVASILAAVSGVANAAAPTLGEVLKASNIDVTGYIDTSFTYRDTDQGSNTFRVFDTERSSFNLHTVDIDVSYLPSSGFGGRAQLDFGRDANVFAPAGTGNADEVDVQEAYVQYTTGGLAVIGGKFVTLAGAEVIESPSNTNFSRSFLFGFAIPFTHTGVRATYTASDSLKFMAGINNGWDAFRTSAKSGADSKTIELGVAATPIKLLSLAAAAYHGEETSAVANDDRTLVDLVATFNISDAMSVVVNYDRGEQKNAVAAGTAKWDGLAAYFNYKLNDTWRLSARAEEFRDKNCFRTSCGFTDQKLKEVTLTVGYAPAKNAELRFEARQDKSDRNVFTKGGAPEDKQMSLGLEAIYKF